MKMKSQRTVEINVVFSIFIKPLIYDSFGIKKQNYFEYRHLEVNTG